MIQKSEPAIEYSAPVTDVMNIHVRVAHIPRDPLLCTVKEDPLALGTALGLDPVQKGHREFKGKFGLCPFFRGFFRVLFVGRNELHDLVRGHTKVDKFLKTK